jgi:hypothetical protein
MEGGMSVVSSKGRVLFENNELKITQFEEEIHLEELQAPALSDSVMVVKARTFWAMVKKCKGLKRFADGS